MPPIPRQRSSSAPHFGVLLYVCLLRLTQNDQVRPGNSYGARRRVLGQPRHCVCTNANASRGLSAIAEFVVKSLNVIESDTVRSDTYDFLLVIHSVGLSRIVSEIIGDIFVKNANFSYIHVVNSPAEGVTAGIF